MYAGWSYAYSSTHMNTGMDQTQARVTHRPPGSGERTYPHVHVYKFLGSRRLKEVPLSSQWHDGQWQLSSRGNGLVEFGHTHTHVDEFLGSISRSSPVV